MTFVGWMQVAIFLGLVALVTKPLGVYLHRVLERAPSRVEWALFHACGVDPDTEQTWQQYLVALLLFSVLGLVVTYALQRLQAHLPLNPQHFAAVPPVLAFNTAASFVTNTNWQAYSGESTMSHLTQMAALAWQNFVSAAAGIGVAMALARGLTRREARTVGNFWVDLVRATFLVLLPLSLVIAMFFVSQGVVQTLSPFHDVTTLEGAHQLLALGPVATQEAIKQLGTNGGGFFNANSAHPFENPTPFTNLVQMVLVFSIPARAHLHVRPHGDATSEQGWTLFAAMTRAVPRRCPRRATPPRASRTRRCTRLAIVAVRGQHGGQGDALRRRGLGTLRHRDDRRVVRRRERDARQLHAARWPGARCVNIQLGEVDLRRRRRGPLRDPRLRACSRSSSRGSWSAARRSTSARRSRRGR